ncbi:MAG: MFS transporter [Micromonosporaceae bacterium]|nr:MFS transporter [Micromonosporaceae bacterium]
MVRSFLVLYLTQAQQLSPAAVGAVVAAVGVGDIGSQLLGGWLGDRIGRRHTMLVGFLGAAVALVALGSADSLPEIWAAAVGIGLTTELYRPMRSTRCGGRACAACCASSGTATPRGRNRSRTAWCCAGCGTCGTTRWPAVATRPG